MELKNCPHCGESDTPVVTTHAELYPDWDDAPLNYFAVFCDASNHGCGATGGFFNTEDGAIKAWNRRAESDLLAALKELVRLSGHSALDDDCPVCVATANARAAIARYEK